MLPIVAAAAMRTLDRSAIEELGIPGPVLMEHAGRALADVAAREAAVAGVVGAARIAVVCGAGNNGGDGAVAARWLADAGHTVKLVLAAGEPKTADAKGALASTRATGGDVVALDADGVAAWIAGADVVVDALLGTGLARAPEGGLAAAIELIGGARGRIVAADVPSGVDADTGHVPGVAVRAHATVTFAALKPGIATGAGAGLAGVVTVAAIGVPRVRLRAAASAWIYEDADVAEVLAPRPVDAHKGTSGHVLVVGGAPGRAGAARLAGLGALRAGAGLVTLAVPPAVRAAVEGKIPEIMVEALDPDAPDAPGQLAALAAGKRAIVWGPGGTRGETTSALLAGALATTTVPMVLDAEALGALAGAPSPALGPGPRVLTPHPGEAARLLGTDVPTVQRDRLGAARALAARYGQVVVLKGMRTVVADPKTQPVVIAAGDPVLGTGGTGDVLAGVIGALLAQGLAAGDAARVAAHLHGRAGERLGQHADRGKLAREVARAIPGVIAGIVRRAPRR